jgi:fructose-1,6-bisphosphatase/inositol monophosphatase family enzyme
LTTLSPAELERRAATALELAELATALIADPHGQPVRALKDGVADWVTSTDIAVEQMVRDLLGERFPADGIVGEELDNSSLVAGRPVWYVDPIDGTTNFANGLRICSFSLALADGAGLAVGVVADVWRDEVFSAIRGQGARCRSGAARCRADTTLQGAVVLTELVGTVPWDGMTEIISALGRQGCATRLLGSSALCLANVGAGRAAAGVLGRAHPIDVAAGALIARESGAVVRVGAHVDGILVRRDGAGPDEPGPDELGPDELGPDELGPDELGPDELGPGPALVAAAPGVYAQFLRTLRAPSEAADAPGELEEKERLP